jgi:hypothetical protein
MTSDAQKELRAAWDDLIESLQRARDAIDQPELMPAPQNDRNLAEGYRYLMGFVHSAVERAFHEDPQRPHFRNALSILNRATIDSADAIYFFAPIDGRRQYWIRGKAEDTREWRGEEPAATGRKAPHYLIFEASAGVLAGDSGDLRELAPGVKTRTGMLDSSSLQVERNGSFEILLAPERPDGFTGNFISTGKSIERARPSEPDSPSERFANYISGRQLFNDWEREDAIHFEIEAVDDEATSAKADAPVRYGPEQAAAQLRRCGELARGQMHFWNAFWTILMGTYGHREGGIPGVEFSRNAFNEVNAASGATGGGMSTNLYAGGVFELEPDETLIVENRVPLAPQYIGFQLGNLWGESLDFANRLGSLNGAQTEVDPDGVLRSVVAHRDPGVPNWLDTSGHREGFLTPRWAYSETPPPEQWPSLTATKVAFDDVRAQLPPNTRTVSPDQRREQIRIRQAHVQRRYRAF